MASTLGDHGPLLGGWGTLLGSGTNPAVPIGWRNFDGGVSSTSVDDGGVTSRSVDEGSVS